MKTRNLLPSIANDVWTSDVLFRVYESVLLTHPTQNRPMAWIAKGVDFDEDGIFEPSTEYDAWGERPNATTPLLITVYYDFNGVRWHDGTQMTVWDLFFSYHVDAMNARFLTDTCVLVPGGCGTYNSGGRQLTVAPVSKVWSGEGQMPGDRALRVAVEFTLSRQFVLFYESTLAPVMLPMHVWSRTGGGRHTDFGCAIWIPPAEATARGIPECGNTDPARHGMGIGPAESVAGSKPYHYPSAEGWALTDVDVIGHGPFRFDRWEAGVSVNLLRNDDFYVGGGLTTNPGRDDRLARLLRKPAITGIEFRVYKSTQMGVFALLLGEIDFYHWNVGAEFVPDLLKHSEIAVESNAEPGYFYMGYNMRRAPWGYEDNDPANDTGFGFRQAVAHLVDKRAIVQNLLQNFGVGAHGFVSPANTFWYNDNIPKPTFDLAAANAILDDLATPGGEYYDARFTLDPPGDCHKDNDAGCRSLPNIGNAEFPILTPQADYDPVRASVGAMIADSMRRVGINAVSRPTAFGTIVQTLTIHDFDLFILGWRITGNDPDYLYSFFGCGNVIGECNILGYNNPEFNQVIEASRAEMDKGVRQSLIYRAQEILARDRPAEPLYYRTSIEAFRQDRFTNWTVSSGTIWNFWSLIGIRPPGSATFTLAMNAPTALAAEEDVPIELQARDLGGAPVSDAEVRLNITSGPGEDPGMLVVDGREGTQITLRTNALGGATAHYAAPRFFDGVRQIFLSATASHPYYEHGSQDTTILTVIGPDLSFLRIDVDLPLGDLARPGVAVPMVVELRDRWGVVHDGYVAIEAIPAGEASPSAGRSQDIHQATVSFPSPGVHTVSFNATKEGHRDAWGVVTVWVVADAPTPPPDLPPTTFPPEFPTAALAGLAAVATSLLAAVVYRMIRKGSRRR